MIFKKKLIIIPVFALVLSAIILSVTVWKSHNSDPVVDDFEHLPDDEMTSVAHSALSNQISPFDDLFKRYAKLIDWDWTLLASIAYQESNFDTVVVSHAGAVGLMGLMPRTAEAYGLDPEFRTEPGGSISVSVRYIRELKKYFPDITSKNEKIKFILASYNAGQGHVLDAQALACKLGKDPTVWEDNVEECLQLKSLPEYYNDSICQHGALQATETINFVREVMARWGRYNQELKNEKNEGDENNEF